jgi:hypothetical protein
MATSMRATDCDLWLLSSTNDFQCDKDCFLVGNRQQGHLMTQTDSLTVLRGFDATTLTYKSKKRFLAPSQQSWLHRVQVFRRDVVAGVPYDYVVATELLTDRLLVLSNDFRTGHAPLTGERLSLSSAAETAALDPMDVVELPTTNVGRLASDRLASGRLAGGG